MKKLETEELKIDSTGFAEYIKDLFEKLDLGDLTQADLNVPFRPGIIIDGKKMPMNEDGQACLFMVDFQVKYEGNSFLDALVKFIVNSDKLSTQQKTNSLITLKLEINSYLILYSQYLILVENELIAQFIDSEYLKNSGLEMETDSEWYKRQIKQFKDLYLNVELYIAKFSGEQDQKKLEISNTSLSRQQTSLLINYLLRFKIIKDLSKKQLGEVFQKLTGHSGQNIRTDLSPSGIEAIETPENFEALINTLETILSELKSKK